MNIRHGGKLHPQIFWRIKQYEQENNYEHFPGYKSSTLEDYLRVLEDTQQFKIIYGGPFKEPIAFALWWYLPTIQICERKLWKKPFPSDLSFGNFAYIDWTWSHPNYRRFNYVRRMLVECAQDHPEKSICFHRILKDGSQKFHYRKPLLRSYEKAA